MWNIVMGLCCSSENTLPSSSLPLEWCSGITNQEDSNEVQSNKLSIDPHELENMVKLFTKRAINGVSLSIYDKTSQSFVDGKYFINRNLGILTLKTVTETVIIPFKAITALLSSSEFVYLYANNSQVPSNCNTKQMVIIIFDSNTERSDIKSLWFKDESSASQFLLCIEVLR